MTNYLMPTSKTRLDRAAATTKQRNWSKTFLSRDVFPRCKKCKLCRIWLCRICTSFYRGVSRVSRGELLDWKCTPWKRSNELVGSAESQQWIVCKLRQRLAPHFRREQSFKVECYFPYGNVLHMSDCASLLVAKGIAEFGSRPHFRLS